MRRALLLLLMAAGIALIVWAGWQNWVARSSARQAQQERRVDLVPDTQSAVTDDSSGGSPLKGKSAPAFTLPDLNGNKVSLSDFKGHPLLINYWGTYCAPCKIEMPWLQEFSKKYAADGLADRRHHLRLRGRPRHHCAGHATARRDLPHPALQPQGGERLPERHRGPAHVVLRRQERQSHRSERRPGQQRAVRVPGERADCGRWPMRTMRFKLPSLVALALCSVTAAPLASAQVSTWMHRQRQSPTSLYAAEPQAVAANKQVDAAASLPAGTGLPHQLAHTEVKVPDPDHFHPAAGNWSQAGHAGVPRRTALIASPSTQGKGGCLRRQLHRQAAGRWPRRENIRWTQRLKYQACDNASCYPPSTLPVKILFTAK